MSFGHDERRTIFALATGVGKAAVAIVRISGPSAAKALLALTGRVPDPRTATFSRISDPDTGQLIDTGLTLWFPGSASFTGEDCAELQTHGSRAVVAAILKTLAKFPDLRMAQPGEFVRRAFMNGKMDLVSVEAIGDLIESETEQQRRMAILQASGKLQETAASWRVDLINALVLIEGELDFSDDVGVSNQTGRKVQDICQKILQTIDGIIAENTAERLRDGMSVLIAGPPNAGKSTFLNALARRDVAIVSERAGTTRDLIEVKLDLAGFPVNFIDTAGIRESDDPIEKEGIGGRSRRGRRRNSSCG